MYVVCMQQTQADTNHQSKSIVRHRSILIFNATCLLCANHDHNNKQIICLRTSLLFAFHVSRARNATTQIKLIKHIY